MLKRKINKNLYLIAFLFTLAIFLSGIFVGRIITNARADSLEVSQKAISALFDLAVIKEKNLINGSNCNVSWSDIWKEKIEIGQILIELENRLGKNNKKVMELKTLYNDLQIKIYGIVEKSNKDCNYNWDIILFFYTNKKEENYKLSEMQGYILDTVYNANEENVKIFSFDVNVDSDLVSDLKLKYNIKSTPTLIINDKKYDSFLSKNEIKNIIK